MEHLSGMDAAFLHLETPEMPMHVGSLMLMDLPEGYAGDFYEDVKSHVGRRLHLARVFQRKLALMPFELTNPVWVDDEDLDLDHHIRHVMLPRPGTHAQLEKMIGRLHSPLLDRSRPLWEMVVISGLNSGQVAVYSKVHHSAIDGQAGVALAKALLDISPQPRAVKAPRPTLRTNRYQLGVAELASASVSNLVQQTVKLARSLPTVVRAARDVLLPVDDATGKRRLSLSAGITLPPRTQLNVAITNARSFATRTLPLDELKRIAKATETSLNDVVLAICSGALRRYLADYDARPAGSLNAGVPVSLREQGNDDMTNQVSFMRVSLATDVKDPIARLRAINESSQASKSMSGQIKGAIPMDFPSLGAPWLMTGLASLFGRSRLADRLPPLANVVISNVPGPQAPLYLAGAMISRYAPVSIPAHGMALNITVQSYNGTMEFGLTACRRAVPDIDDLADHIEAAALELVRAVESHAQVRAAEQATAEKAAAERAAVPRRTRAHKRPKLTVVAGAEPGTPATRTRRGAVAA